MLIAQNELNSLRTLAAKIKQTGSQAMRTVGLKQGEQMKELMGLAAQMETRLDRAGAERPAVVAAPMTVPLALLDTPANRRYVRDLRTAWESALAVDRERYGENIGTDGCAQAVEMILADAEQELHGPVSSLRE